MDEGERRSVSMGEGSLGSRELEGEGGEGFCTAQTGRRPDLLVDWDMGITNEGWLRVLMDRQTSSDA